MKQTLSRVAIALAIVLLSASCTTLQRMSDERGAATPEPVARRVCRILDSERPRLRYTIGPFTQRLAVHLKKALPGRVFESILASTYRLDARASRAHRGRAK